MRLTRCQRTVPMTIRYACSMAAMFSAVNSPIPWVWLAIVPSNSYWSYSSLPGALKADCDLPSHVPFRRVTPMPSSSTRPLGLSLDVGQQNGQSTYVLVFDAYVRYAFTGLGVRPALACTWIV